MKRAKASATRRARAAIAVLSAFATVGLMLPALPAHALSDVNLAGNPGFETDTSGWNTSGVPGVALARVAGGHSGGWAAELTNGGLIAQNCVLNDGPNWVSATSAATYTAAMWVRTDAPGQTFTLRIREFDPMAVPMQVGSATITAPLTTEWQQISLSYEPVAPGASNLDLQGYVELAAVGQCFLADDVSITKSHPTVTVEQAAGQADPTNASPISFEVTFSEPVTGFEDADVTLGGTAGATTAVVTGSGASYMVEVSGMTSDGTVTASLPADAAIDPLGQGNLASTSTDNTVTYDASGPVVEITDAPPALTSSADASFTFSSADGDVDFFECRLDGGAWGMCTSPVDHLGLAEGPHTFDVRATDLLGNTGAPATHEWTIDLTAPTSTIDFPAAAGVYNADEWALGCDPADPGFCGSAADANGVAQVTLTLQQVGGDYWDPASAGGQGAFDSPVPVPILADGTASWHSPFDYADFPQDDDYTLTVSATDNAGNVEAEHSVTFTTDRSPTVIVEQAGGQADPTNASPISFEVTFSEPVIGFEDADVTLSGTAGATTAVVTGAGASYTVEVSGMTSDGTVIASVEAGVAVDGAGNPNQASTSTDNTVTYDTQAPDTTIDAAPPDPSGDDSPSFEFSSTEGGSSFECRLDSADEGDFAPCASPQDYMGLADGEHTFEVRATDPAGNTDPTPASHTWTIDTAAPVAAITFPVDGETYHEALWGLGCPTPGFCGTAIDAGTGVAEVTLSLRLLGGNYWDGDGFDSPVEVRFPAAGTTDWSEAFAFADLPPGTFALNARAVDGAGNAGSGTSTFSTIGIPPIPGMPTACTVPTIVGSGVVLGTPGDDVIVAGPGNVTVRGRGGNDVVCTGNGNDVIVTKGGDDLVYSSGGRNIVTTRAGADRVTTRGGRDTIRTGGGPDDVRGGKGKNFIYSGGGRDEVRTGKGPDQIRSGGGGDLVRAGHGRNRVWGGAGRDLLFTGNGRDRVNGGPGVDTCRSGGGHDVILNCERGTRLSLTRGQR